LKNFSYSIQCTWITDFFNFSALEIGILLNMNLNLIPDEIKKIMQDIAYRNTLAENAYRFVNENYSAYRGAKNYIGLYEL